MSSAESVLAVIEAAGNHVPVLMERVEERLAALAAGTGAPLAEHALATIGAGGKRLRPLCVLLSAGPPADGVAEEELVRAGAAVELIHSATLVHDDVIDGASLRRGVPTVFAHAGRTVAVATGDALFATAFGELVRSGSVAQVRALSAAASALAAGELRQRADAWAAEVSVERYEERCDLKTASLFEAACRIGALIGGGPVEPLAGFGVRIGRAFQLLDDVLDVVGPAETTGKHRGADLLDGTVTLPLILARVRDGDLAALDLRAIQTPAAAEEVCERIAATGALEDARVRALTFVEEAKLLLHELPDGQRGALELVADGVVERYS